MTLEALDAFMGIFGLTRADDPDRGPLPPGEPVDDDSRDAGSDAPGRVGSDPGERE